MVSLHLKLILAHMLRILLTGRGGVSENQLLLQWLKTGKMEVTWTRMVIVKVVKSSQI